MHSRALTVTLNYNQTREFVHLITETPDAHDRPLKQRIVQEAKNKFRIKSLSSVFLPGGTLLEDGQDIPENTDQVWVGKGEPYAGPPAPVANAASSPANVRVIGVKSFIDDSAVKQLERVASLSGVRMAVGMPDLHPGGRFPIGCAIASEGIYPALIGLALWANALHGMNES